MHRNRRSPMARENESSKMHSNSFNNSGAGSRVTRPPALSGERRALQLKLLTAYCLKEVAVIQGSAPPKVLNDKVYGSIRRVDFEDELFMSAT